MSLVRFGEVHASPQGRAALRQFLESVEHEFCPPLTSFLNLDEYTSRVLKQGTVIGAYGSCESLVGVAVLYCSPTRFHFGWISLIASTLRRVGVARALLLQAADVCRYAGLDGVETQTWKSNAASRSLFEDAGFELIGMKNNREDRDEPSAVYRMTFNSEEK